MAFVGVAVGVENKERAVRRIEVAKEKYLRTRVFLTMKTSTSIYVALPRKCHIPMFSRGKFHKSKHEIKKYINIFFRL